MGRGISQAVIPIRYEVDEWCPGGQRTPWEKGFDKGDVARSSQETRDRHN